MPARSSLSPVRFYGLPSLVCFGIALFLLIAVSAEAAQNVVKVKVENLLDRVQITVSSSEPIKSERHQGSSFVAIDVRGISEPKAGRMRIMSGNIWLVRFGPFQSNPPVTRIVVSTKYARPYDTSFSDDRREMVVRVYKAGYPKSTQQTKSSVFDQNALGTVKKPLGKLPAFQFSAITEAPKPIEPADNFYEIEKPDPQGSDGSVMDVVRQVPKLLAKAPKKQAQTAAEKPQSRASAERRISLDFINADITEILKAISIQSGKNIVAGPDVTGKLTVTLNDVTLEEALNYVTKLAGFQYVLMGDKYLVGLVPNLVRLSSGSATGGIVTETVTIRHANPEAIVEAASSHVPNVKFSIASGGKSQKSESEGSESGSKDKKYIGRNRDTIKVLILSGPKEEVEFAKQILANVERHVAEGYNSYVTGVYYVKYAYASDLRMAMEKLFPEVVVVEGSSDGLDLLAQKKEQDGSAKGDLLARSRILVISAPNNQMLTAAIETLEKIDLKPKQILIEAKVTDIRVSAQKRLGFTWDWSSFGVIQRVGAQDAIDQPINVTRAFTHTPISFSATLSAMLNNGDAYLLANPKVAAIEGKTATAFIGDRIKYVKNIDQTQFGRNVQTDEVEVGIILRVVGNVGPDDYITLNIHPEVSVIRDFLKIGSVGGTDIALPQIASRYADSVIRVKNGETIVIGGLIRDEDLKNIRKIPILGDIPFFGHLFTWREKIKDHSEILIFITCNILED